jgi:hypothetical protein
VTDPKPRLVAVGGQPTADAPRGDPAREDAPRAPARARWVLVALLVLAVGGLVLQTTRVAWLSGRVEALSGELGAARSALVAYRSQLDAVRDSVADLQTRLAELDALVNHDPLDAPREAPAD